MHFNILEDVYAEINLLVVTNANYNNDISMGKILNFNFDCIKFPM
ncbi:MAG: hypothetical protein ACI8XI_001236 [Woeseiaceae bacterium]|jgi:hypothetical protein|tara:strand:- start:23952 stop:24086 length:135 start_codon:yes stop_codon:yes gene_type:complete